MKKFGLIGLTALMLISCGDNGKMRSEPAVTETSSADFAPPPPAAPMMTQKADLQIADGRKQRATPSPIDQNNGADPAGIYLAYRYGYGLVMPAKAVKTTVEKHMQACREAGPTKCQITGSNTNNHTDENISAHFSMRADPDWLESFLTGLKQDVKDADGRIQSANTSVEDLTRAILDTDSRLKAKKTLRTRLENLLETRNAKLPDLLALERELARVQGEIESATANLKALRARVSMSVVNISYSSERLAVSRSAFSPVGSALKDFANILSQGVAGVIRFTAYLLPWLIFIIIPGLFALRWFWRRRKIKKTES